ncbi:MAG: hypothetical protein ACOCYC_03925 [bacterium]
MTTAPETLGHFKLDGNLENTNGSLKVSASSPDLEYQTLESGAQVATVGYLPQVHAEPDSSNGGDAHPVLEIELSEQGIPGTISFWAHRLEPSIGSSPDDYDAVTASVRVSTESSSMENEFEHRGYGPGRRLYGSVEFTENTGELTRNAARARVGGHELRGGQVRPGEAANPYYHVVVTVDTGGAAGLFVDGEEEESVLNYDLRPQAESLFLTVSVDALEREESERDPDTDQETYTRELIGLTGVDNLRLYRHALTREEIRQLYETERQELSP